MEAMPTPVLTPGIQEVAADLAIMEALAKITLILTPRDPLTPLELFAERSTGQPGLGPALWKGSSGSWPEDALGSGVTKDPER